MHGRLCVSAVAAQVPALFPVTVHSDVSAVDIAVVVMHTLEAVVPVVIRMDFFGMFADFLGNGGRVLVKSIGDALKGASLCQLLFNVVSVR